MPDHDAPRARTRIGATGWARVGLRGSAMILVLLLGVLAMLALRLVERPIHGRRRPWTPHITQWVCRGVFLCLGLRHRAEGQPMIGPGAVVANHSSWLDIFALNARKRIYFVSKSEVANWPGIGSLARIAGTVFITRNRMQARAQTELFLDRMQAGHKLLFFPEGTSTDGFRVLQFKSTLFQAFFDQELHATAQIQPVIVIYHAPADQDPRFYGWWGNMDFAPHLLKVLAAASQGTVTVKYHPPVRVADFRDRKALAAHLEHSVRAGMPPDRRKDR